MLKREYSINFKELRVLVLISRIGQPTSKNRQLRILTLKLLA